jgi:putative transposase
VRAQLHVSERRACAALGQHRSTQRKIPRGREDEERLTADIIELARQYGRYGYRKIAALLRQAGWTINDKRVERIWQREGLKVPHKQPKRGRLWLADGSCIWLRPQQRNHVWSYDFVEDRTHDGRKYRMLRGQPLGERLHLELQRSESRSQTTFEDALYSAALLKPKPSERWLLVTLALHMPRAVKCFRSAGFQVQPYPVELARPPHY